MKKAELAVRAGRRGEGKNPLKKPRKWAGISRLARHPLFFGKNLGICGRFYGGFSRWKSGELRGGGEGARRLGWFVGLDELLEQRARVDRNRR
jgi:hypothetical protein